MAFEQYIQKGSQRLRCGFTTGSCAALAAKAAAVALLTGKAPGTVAIMTPKRLSVEVPVLEAEAGADYAVCAVMKDSGDDPDVTNGALVYARVTKTEAPGIAIDGGTGVGRVTKPGLDQPVGAAAINRVPRQMIAAEVQSVCDRYGYAGGVSVVISIPAGAALAARTFNPKLGIEGGLSVLGTSGIVEPMSAQALIDTIGVELRQLAAKGYRKVILTPGNYGEAFLKTMPYLTAAPTVKFSNFAGDTLDFAAAYGFQKILVVGHAGKLVKLAGGIMNTHSAVADCRGEIIAAHAALHGAGREAARALMDAVSTDACLDILDRMGLLEDVLSSLLGRIQEQLQRRAGGGTEIGAVMFSNVRGLLGQTETAPGIIDSFYQEEK
ncbi:cobalt-precorrin 5B C1-methyltransferase [Sporobacter termitidis DSM 10068]|uniref:Cobalt-precorrin-5B C(1)-methyltransferase n=1 Tax=Sporobacter termitidis DSM 10068 TaxID=1123282 RepID=A0A1M5XJA9_9FIRM|nr:cobalt-precorrin-5B (C(1))-methyltransferase CbiD [Sporobacter termitidis]SHH99955.1 cobalt-precorrin 5B C1-methyltransferase [Sporobacter termitidis DSM 10068]